MAKRIPVRISACLGLCTARKSASSPKVATMPLISAPKESIRWVNSDTTTNLTLARVFADGDFKHHINVKLGRQELYTNEHGLVFDDNFSGANLQFGNQFKVNLLGGRINSNNISSNTNSVIETDSLSASKKIWKITDILYKTM